MKATGDSRVVLRQATRGDYDAIGRLLTSAHLPLDGVSEALDDFVVAEKDSALVGVAGLEVRGPDALIRSVAVSEELRGHGLGRELVARAIDDATSRGLRALYLLTTTAENYFPKFGFEHTTRDAVPDGLRATAEFQGACPASAIVMSRRLLETTT